MTEKYNFDHIILLTGQSNALGAGGIYDAFNIDDQPDNRIWGYVSSHDYWTVFDLKLQIGSKKPNYQCMAFHYAKRLLVKYPNWKIGIIICGLSGQSITRWVVPYMCTCHECHMLQSNIVNKHDKGDIYDWSVLMVSNALSHCKSSNNVNTIMWHQGESDFTETETWYYQRLKKVIKQYRNNEWYDETCEFLCGQLYENAVTSKMNYVFQLQHGWKYFQILNISYDNIHYFMHHPIL